MANLIGHLEYGHHARKIHRLAHYNISARLATWHTFLDVSMDKYGRVRMTLTQNGKVVKNWEYKKSELSKKDMDKIKKKEEAYTRRRERSDTSFDEQVAKIDKVLEKE